MTVDLLSTLGGEIYERDFLLLVDFCGVRRWRSETIDDSASLRGRGRGLSLRRAIETVDRIHREGVLFSIRH